jgi:hypothetical protein
MVGKYYSELFALLFVHFARKLVSVMTQTVTNK